MGDAREVSAPRSAALLDLPGQIVELSEEECWCYLRCGDLGRLAIIVEGRPEIFPMNYAVSGDSVLFRTAPGTKLRYAPGSAAAFEIDGYAAETGTGWSVVAQGPMEKITESLGSGDVRDVSVHPYASGVKEHTLVLNVARVTGRRFSWGPMAPRPSFLPPLD